MYTTHITSLTGSEQSSEYYMIQQKGFSLTGNSDTCWQGFIAFQNEQNWTKKKHNQFISAANEWARFMNADQSTLESFNYNAVSNITNTFSVEGSQTSADEFVIISFLNCVEKSELSDDKLTISLFSHSVATLFLYSTKKFKYNNLADITEKLKTSADKLVLSTYMKSTLFKKHLIKKLKKTVVKAFCHTISTFHHKHCFKK